MCAGQDDGADAWTGFLAAPVHGSGAGVLVLAGSSGRVEEARCRLLAREGLTALSVRWFGGPGQPPGICEVPLETFVSAVARLRAHGARRTAHGASASWAPPRAPRQRCTLPGSTAASMPWSLSRPPR
ncbi:hypothetical protein OG471_32310 [Streptomyces sp. NBC_01336]|uniref:hypothetical protein n=1 Tax=Streptomyces sp. NBC_01336 TaxID=2903829 RepID=UPI002E167F52|nr:hypothetical protein OG471_32310 [Streptomyces sp. NBC_01336]